MDLNRPRRIVADRVQRLASRLFRPILDDALDRDSHNIARWRRRSALAETAAFIEETMPTVQSHDDPREMLRYAVSRSASEGMVCEFGVAQGRTINQIASLVLDRRVYGFDSFEGLPEDWYDGEPKGKYRVEALPKVRPNVTLIKGMFSDTLGPFLEEHLELAAFLHVDCDLYSSTRCVLDHFRSRIRVGTVIVFDEYFNYPGWKHGEYRAFMECSRDWQLNVRVHRLLPILRTGRGPHNRSSRAPPWVSRERVGDKAPSRPFSPRGSKPFFPPKAGRGIDGRLRPRLARARSGERSALNWRLGRFAEFRALDLTGECGSVLTRQVRMNLW